MAEVNPSQKSPSDTHKAWIVVQKEDGQIQVTVLVKLGKDTQAITAYALFISGEERFVVMQLQYCLKFKRWLQQSNLYFYAVWMESVFCHKRSQAFLKCCFCWYVFI